MRIPVLLLGTEAPFPAVPGWDAAATPGAFADSVWLLRLSCAAVLRVLLAAQKIMEKSATAEGTGIPGDTLTNSEEMSIRHKVDELKIHMNQENEDQ